MSRRWLGGLAVGVTLALLAGVLGVLPAAAATNLVIGESASVVHTSGEGVNFRTGTTLDARVISVLPDGTSVQITGGPVKGANGLVWYSVVVHGTPGWIDGEYLAQTTAMPTSSATVVNTGGDALRFRAGPGFQYAITSLIPEGTSLPVVGSQVVDTQGNVWVDVNLQGHSGYVFAGYVGISGFTPRTVPIVGTYTISEDFGCVPNTPGYPQPTSCPASAPSFHDGVDLAAPAGTAIVAAASGTVTFVGPDSPNPGANSMILIQHDGANTGYTTEYLHWEQSFVKVGQHVAAGQRIAAVGSVGNATGPHLHFTVKGPSGTALDPLAWLDGLIGPAMASGGTGTTGGSVAQWASASVTGAGSGGVLQWASLIQAAARQYNVPAGFIAAIMTVESDGNPGSISPVGAQGLMQVMPAELRAFGVPQAQWLDPATNILAGARYIAGTLNGGGTLQAAAASYFGQGCDVFGTCTAQYVARVMAWYGYYAAIFAGQTATAPAPAVSTATTTPAPAPASRPAPPATSATTSRPPAPESIPASTPQPTHTTIPAVTSVSPTPTVAPAPTPKPTPVPTATPTMTATPSPTTTPTATPAPTPKPTATPTPRPTPAPSPSPTVTPSPTPSPTPTVQTVTPTPSTATPSPTPTATPSATTTAKP